MKRILYNFLRIWRRFLYSLVRFPHQKIRVWAMRKLGFHVGQDTYIGPNLRMAVGYADTSMQLYIGNRVTLALNDTLIFASRPHPVSSRLKTYFPPSHRKIVIGDDSWIGANVVILPNITIGKCCVVGAGAVVTHDVPDYSIVAGVPARIIKTIDSSLLND